MENRREAVAPAPKRKVLDLTAVQVVASALATVVGAVLASLLGVTGTLVGAAVVSASATTGAAVFSHAFRRTGEGIRGRMPPVGVPRTPGEERAEHRADARAAFGLPGEAPVTDALRPFAPSEGESVTTYRGGAVLRSFGWRKYALATGLVFALAMVTVTAGELIMGKPVAAVVRNEPGSGTSVGGGSADSRGPADGGTPAPESSGGSAPQTDGSTSPEASGVPDTGSGSSPSPGPSRGSNSAASPSASVAEPSEPSEPSKTSEPFGGGAASSSEGPTVR
ncbi:hypothetical protein ACIP2Y_03190 [Streptomyces sviceus]|uniref:hypothetical protein n=1 Tax=Streptomyces sviceus TaxID=285530 RepID=UPI0037FCC8FC